jgi:hypothetical protein
VELGLKAAATASEGRVIELAGTTEEADEAALTVAS